MLMWCVFVTRVSHVQVGVFDNAAVKLSFMRFFAHVMAGYQEFVTLDPPSAEIAK
jgi:hypothetical protein